MADAYGEIFYGINLMTAYISVLSILLQHTGHHFIVNSYIDVRSFIWHIFSLKLSKSRKQLSVVYISQCDQQKKSPDVYKSCLKMISLEK